MMKNHVRTMTKEVYMESINMVGEIPTFPTTEICKGEAVDLTSLSLHCGWLTQNLSNNPKSKIS